MVDSEIRKLIKEIETLNCKANAWDRIVDFFDNNEYIQPIFKEVSDELMKEQCFSHAIHIIETIRRILDKLED
jgi:hypothetical protein